MSLDIEIDTSIDTSSNEIVTPKSPVIVVAPYGFIITRHVRDEKTNEYWNMCVKRIRRYYPYVKIVIIDDNSNQQFLKPHKEYQNVEIILSEFAGRGELLPYFYFYKHKWFPFAVIIHDSVFFHKRVSFEKLLSHPVLPLWHFKPDKENISNSIRIASSLKNNENVIRKLNYGEDFVSLFEFKNKTPQGWDGCFGVQSLISHGFVSLLQNKYNIFNMIPRVTCRADRCSLERIMSILFFQEYTKLQTVHSLFGDIFRYQNFGYSYESYQNDLKKGVVPRYVVKVWTGR